MYKVAKIQFVHTKNINLTTKTKVSSPFTGSANWEPSRGVAWCRPFSSPAFSTYNGESARSARWAEVGTHHPQSEKPPLLIRVHPHYMLAAPSTTPQHSGRGPFAREQALYVSTCVCVCVRARTTHLHAFVRSSSTVNPSQTHTYTQPRSKVQKGRDWQCRGPTCPLPQHGHAPRGSTWPFSSSGWCATVKPALRILRGTHTAGADATNKSYITNTIPACLMARMLALLDSRQCRFLLGRRLRLRSRWLIILTDVGCSISVTVLAVPVAKWWARKEHRGRRSTRRGGRPCVGLATWYRLATRFSSSSWQRFHAMCLSDNHKIILLTIYNYNCFSANAL